MANLVAGNTTAVRMDQIDVANLWDGTITEQSDTKLMVDIGGGYVEHFTGFGLTYSGLTGDPLSGTITGYQETLLGQPTFTVTGLNISAVDFNTWVNNDDTFGALAHMFAGNDSMTGGSFNDFMAGLDGHDILMGGAGADTLAGNAGNDHLYGQSNLGGPDGADSILGGDGIDYLQGNAGNDTLDGGNNADRINGGADNDLIYGGDGNDAINGNLGNDTIDGGFGSDLVRGGKGDDLIQGHDGNDTLMGDLGNDTIDGGAGNDLMTGGDGADVFRFDRFSGSESNQFVGGGLHEDHITDYQQGVDHIQLEFKPTAILTGTASDDIHAVSDARDLMIAHTGYGEVALMQVGTDTYLLSSGAGDSDFEDVWVKIDNTTAANFTFADFV